MDKIIFRNGEAPYINDTNLNKVQENAEKAINERKPTIELLTVSDTAPSTCAMGDKYYNTTTSKIYTATATNTWGTEGENPSNLYLYADLEHKELYYYDGADFKSYGSGKKEIGYVGEEQEGTEVILIEDSDFYGENSVELAKVEQNLTSNSENTVPSVKAVNDVIKTNITTGQEVATNEYEDGKQVFAKKIDIGSLPNATRKIVETGLSNVKVTKLHGIARNSTLQISLPFVYTELPSCIGVMFVNGSIYINTGSDRTDLTGEITIHYTKNT